MKKPDRLSASKMKTYKLCQFKYFMSYGLYAPQKPSFAAELGTVLHWIYELYAQAILEGKAENGMTAEEIERDWKKLLQTEGFEKLDSWQWCRHVGKVEKSCDTCPAHADGTCKLVDEKTEDFNGCPWNAWVEAQNMVTRVLSPSGPADIFTPEKKIVGTEDKFEIEFEALDGHSVTLNGLIDMVVELDEDTLEIIDYKTGRFKMSYKEAEKDLQLRLYYMACRRKYPQYKNHMVTIMYVNEGIKTITPYFGDKTEEDLLVEIAQIYDEIKDIKYPDRIRDGRDGRDRPSHICRYLCDMELCDAVHNALGEALEADPEKTIDSFKSLEDLGIKGEDFI